MQLSATSSSGFPARLATSTGLIGLQNGKLFFGSGHSTLTYEITERKDQWVGDGIDAAGALFPTRDQATLQQQVQVLGDIRLIRVEIFYQFADSLLRPGKRLEQAKSKRLAKVTEPARNQF